MTGKAILQRLLQTILVLLGISFLTFCLTYLAPGDPVQAMYAAAGDVPNEEVMEATREAMGLHRPFLEQYFRWLYGVLHGDLGTSYSQSLPVVQVLGARLWPTLKLALCSMVLTLLFSVPLGMRSAVKRGQAIDYIIRSCSFVGISLPNFWVGLLLMYVAALKLDLLPVMSADTSLSSLLLPSLTLAVPMTASYTRQVRTAVLEELQQDYVVGARARGLKEGTLLYRHVFPNALFPLVTLLGMSLGSLLAGTAVVEVIFSYPGLGSLAVKAIGAMDYPLIQGYVLWIALIYMGVNRIVDISYAFLDPRTRMKPEVWRGNVEKIRQISEAT